MYFLSGQPPHTTPVPLGSTKNRTLRHTEKMVLRSAKLANQLFDFSVLNC